jgi:PTS system nitrogen regulatory IIA component
MMEIKDMINDTSIIFLNEKYKSDILEAMISKAVEEGYIKDETSFKKAINERETMGSTGIGDEIAIPHARIAGIEEYFIITAVLSQPVEWDSPDHKPVRLVFMIGGPDNAQTEYLQLLSKVMGVVKNPDKKNFIIGSNDPVKIARTFI